MKAPVHIPFLLLGLYTSITVPAAERVDPVGLILPPAFAADKRDSQPAEAVRPPMVVVNAQAEASDVNTMAAQPIALAAMPLEPPPAASGALFVVLREPWQRIAFTGALVCLAGLLFWWLGTRARRPSDVDDISDTPLAAQVREAPEPSARYATLRDAIEAMKAEAAARS